VIPPSQRPGHLTLASLLRLLFGLGFAPPVQNKVSILRGSLGTARNRLRTVWHLITLFRLGASLWSCFFPQNCAWWLNRSCVGTREMIVLSPWEETSLSQLETSPDVPLAFSLEPTPRLYPSWLHRRRWQVLGDETNMLRIPNFVSDQVVKVRFMISGPYFHAWTWFLREGDPIQLRTLPPLWLGRRLSRASTSSPTDWSSAGMVWSRAAPWASGRLHRWIACAPRCERIFLYLRWSLDVRRGLRRDA